MLAASHVDNSLLLILYFSRSGMDGSGIHDKGYLLHRNAFVFSCRRATIHIYITKILINVKSQYVNKTLHVFLRTLPGNFQGPQTCACYIEKDISFTL